MLLFQLLIIVGTVRDDGKEEKQTPERALAARVPSQRDIMEVHRPLAHPSEYITRVTAKATDIITMSEW